MSFGLWLRPLIWQGLLPAVVLWPFSRQSSSLAIWGEVVSGKRCLGLHPGPLQTVGLIPWLVPQLGVHVTAPGPVFFLLTSGVANRLVEGLSLFSDFLPDSS